MINIAIFERSIKRKVVLNSKIFVINLSRWGLQQQLWLREQSGWWQLRVKSKWNLTSSDLSCLDPGHSTRHKLSLDSCKNDTLLDKRQSNIWEQSKCWLQSTGHQLVHGLMFYWSGCLSDDLHTEHDWVGAARARCWQVPTNLNLYRSDTLLASPLS